MTRKCVAPAKRARKQAQIRKPLNLLQLSFPFQLLLRSIPAFLCSAFIGPQCEPVISCSMAAAPAPELPTRRFRTLRGGHRAPLQFVRWTRNGRYAITGGQDRNLCLWNPYRQSTDEGAAEGDALLLKSYAGSHGYEVLDASVSPANDRIASVGGDRCAIVWDATTGVPVRKLWGHEQRISSCDFNADGSVLATGSHDKTVRLFDLRSAGRAPLQVLEDASDNIARVLCGRADIIAASMDGHVRTYDMRMGRVVDDNVGAAPLVSLALSSDGNVAAVATLAGGGSIRLLERPGGVQLKAYTGHVNALYRCTPAFTADDAAVVCGSEDGSITFWDLVTGTVTERIPAAHKRVVSWVDAHPDPGVSAILTASYDGTAALWLGEGVDPATLSLADIGGGGGGAGGAS